MEWLKWYSACLAKHKALSSNSSITKKKKKTFLIKVLKKLRIEGSYLNIIKAIYVKAMGNITRSGEKLKELLLKSGMRQGVLTPFILFQYSACYLSQNNMVREKNIRDTNSEVRSQTISIYR
jgi:hypothetical protein